MADLIPIRNALISVSDKSGLDTLCQSLSEKGVKIYSTGGTAKFIKEQGLEVTGVDSVTQFPEMMDGRVKTLHPRIFGGILARREVSSDLDEAKQHQVPLFDLIVVNLYPFAEHLGKADFDQSSFVDIGGPSLIRAASKNFRSVSVLSDPADYEAFISEFKSKDGSTSLGFRKQLAAKSFGRTSSYDAMIASEWSSEALPASLSLSPRESLRYGENPHQSAGWCGKRDWNLLQGKELSYNNLLDTEAALGIALEFSLPSIAIIKHNNPCGVAEGEGPLAKTFERALACDSKSAFGGIVATNSEVDGKAAEAMSQLFLEVVIAKAFSSEAKEVFSKKKNLRLIEWANPSTAAYDVRRALGGWLVQTADSKEQPESEWKVATKTPVPESVKATMSFAWKVAKHVRSNAIVLAKEGATIGIGAGQMSRVDAVEIALNKCQVATAGAVLASDAFFPFRDNIDLLKGREIAAIIQPGGSKRDGEVIEACDEHGIAMIFTGQRHFRH